MSKKLIVTFICVIVVSIIQSISIAQTDSTVVQPKPTTQTVSGVTIPEGTKLMVNLDKPISTAKNPAGSTFSAILEVDFVYDGKVIAPKGSPVYGKVIECRGGRVLGGSKLTIQFTDIMVNNQLTTIVTDPIGVEGGKGNTAKTVGAGALIGAAFGGAGEGAAVGGALALLSAGKNHIQIPAGTLAEIPLKAPLTIK
ncbi:MAG: hypothetical protein IH618_09575 [Ignavibacteriaceae bacterium]|nr:hypothetical protein [Ignavibacteriaceae bacterium]